MPKESSLESAISAILMTLLVLMTKDFSRLFLIYTWKNSSSVGSYLDWPNCLASMTCCLHIVNFAFMSNNIPSAQAYGDIALPMSIFCSHCSNFLLWHRALVTRLLSQGCTVKHLSKTFKKSYDKCIYQVRPHKKNAHQIFIDPISLNDLHFRRFSMPNQQN